jgi:hypothetical protein
MTPDHVGFNLAVFTSLKAAEAHGGLSVELPHGLIVILESTGNTDVSSQESMQIYTCINNVDK